MINPKKEPSAETSRSKPAQANGSSAREGLEEILGSIRELRDYGTHFLSARVDLAKAQVRRAVMRGAMAAVFGIAFLGFMITAMVMTAQGIADGFAIWIGSVWLGVHVGGLAVELLCFAVIGGGAMVVNRRLLQKTRERYETRRQEERKRNGLSIEERADENPRQE